MSMLVHIYSQKLLISAPQLTHSALAGILREKQKAVQLQLHRLAGYSFQLLFGFAEIRSINLLINAAAFYFA